MSLSIDKSLSLEIFLLEKNLQGLADVKLGKEAAKEISKSLKNDGRFKLIFVVTLEAGRIRPEDVTTINLVLDAINHPVEYGVIVNKVNRKFVQKISNSEGLFHAIFAGFNSGERKTDKFYYMSRDEELEDNDNKLSVLPQDLRDFIYNTVPESLILKEDVREVNFNEFEKMKRQFATEIERIRVDSQKREEAFKQTIAALEKEREEQERNIKEEYETAMMKLFYESEQHKEEMQNKLKEFEREMVLSEESRKQKLEQEKREYEAKMKQIQQDNAERQQELLRQVLDLQNRRRGFSFNEGGGCTIL